MRGESGRNRLGIPDGGALECAVGGLISVAAPVPGRRLLRLFTVPFEQAFAPAPRFPNSLLGTLSPHPVNRPLPQSARNIGPNFPSFRLFHVGNGPRLPVREPTPIPVHGYDITSGLSQSGFPVRRERGRAPLTDHDISPPNSSDSMGDSDPIDEEAGAFDGAEGVSAGPACEPLRNRRHRER